MEYTKAVEIIKYAILQGQLQAAKGVNRVQLAVYYGIGKYLSLNTRKGFWGTGALKIISEQLQKQLPGLRGFSENSLKKMRKFYEEWIMLDGSPVTNNEVGKAKSTLTRGDLQNADYEIDIYNTIRITDIKDFPIEDFFCLPFTHHIRIIEGEKSGLEARYYYIHRAVVEHWQADRLSKYIKEKTYENRGQIPNNFNKTLSDSNFARKAVMMFKDSYLLNFINTEQIGERDSEDVDERVVEQQIVQNIKQFIMTFGKDFTFVGNQYHLEIYGIEHFPDLLFFNRELNALVVIELKTGDFKASYLGQLMAYLAILEEKVKKPHENPPIGIVLCKSANKEYVEFVIKYYDKPMGVATYRVSEDMPDNLRRTLPDIDELKKLLNTEN